jgi:hypothetical protein
LSKDLMNAFHEWFRFDRVAQPATVNAEGSRSLHGPQSPRGYTRFQSPCRLLGSDLITAR